MWPNSVLEILRNVVQSVKVCELKRSILGAKKARSCLLIVELNKCLTQNEETISTNSPVVCHSEFCAFAIGGRNT